MSDYVTPCHSDENDPDDWFLSKDGRQYSDDDLLTQEIIDEAIRTTGLTPLDENYVEEVDRVLAEIEEQVKRAALTRRRHAKDACFTCYFRTQCLGLALERNEQHGTWGGYYEEELREIRRLRDRKRRERGEA